MRLQIIALIGVLSSLVGSRCLAQPVSTESGPLSDMSAPLEPDSRPVHERGSSVSDGSSGPMTSGPVRGSRRVSMISDSVSDASAGPVTSRRPVSGGGSVAENSAGAVKHNIDHSLGEQVFDAQRALDPIQQRLREQAANDAAATAEAGRAALDIPTPYPDSDEPAERSDGSEDVEGEAPHADAAVAADDAPEDVAPAMVHEEQDEEPTPTEH